GARPGGPGLEQEARRAQGPVMRKLPQSLQAWIFLAPALVLLAVFSFWPVGFGAWLAFTDYSLVRSTSWVGLDNFRYIFDNEMFVTGLKNSLAFLLMVPCVQIGA